MNIETLKTEIFDNLIFPKHWELEGIFPPTLDCKFKCFEICKSFFNAFNIIPSRIASSKESGIFVAYDNFKNNRTLFLEIYNDLEVTYLINDNIKKYIIISDDIKNTNLKEIVKILND